MLEKRIVWATTRSVLETNKYKNKRSGKRSRSNWSLFERLLNIFVLFLKISGLYKKGQENAKNIKINEIELEFENLPDSFINYKVLHLSDLHIDSLPGMDNIISKKIESLKYDVCVLTGDYRRSISGSFKNIMRPIKKIVDSINSKDGIYAVLGNHDTYLMAEYEDRLGVKLLINETINIKKGKDKIAITGTDDPFYYFTDQAIMALDEDINSFKIALVHTPELFDVAANNKYDLYLCGHTHGGQICFPGGKPIITHQFDDKKFVNGLWKEKNMIGYTSPGCGVSGIPVRFNNFGEITLFTLKSKG